MKSSQLFWGFFFITFGGIYLTSKYSGIVIDWYQIWELWPILFIISGIAIILKGTFFKPVVSIIFGILVAIFVFSFVDDVFNLVDENHFELRHTKAYSTNNYNVNFSPEIKHANLKINAGAGKFYVEKISDDLIDGFSEGDFPDYEIKNNINDSTAWLEVNLKKVREDFLNLDYKNDFKLRLNENPTWSLEVNVGAAKNYFNLIPFKVKNLVLHTGATNTKIKLGDKTDMTYVDVEMGAASLTVYVPESSGCRLTGEMMLISKDLENFNQIKSNHYETDNFESMEKRIYLNVKGGIASLKIIRY